MAKKIACIVVLLACAVCASLPAYAAAGRATPLGSLFTSSPPCPRQVHGRAYYIWDALVINYGCIHGADCHQSYDNYHCTACDELIWSHMTLAHVYLG